MRLFTAAILFGATTLAAPAAFAQSGYETGAGKPAKSTTNSGAARPDSKGGDAGARMETPTSNARPATSSSGATGERGQRPDAKPTSSKGAPAANSNAKRAAPTQSDD